MMNILLIVKNDKNLKKIFLNPLFCNIHINTYLNRYKIIKLNISAFKNLWNRKYEEKKLHF